MKYLMLDLGLLVVASLACASAQAACSHTVVDLADTSTIIVIAGPNETCEYRDNNAGNWRAMSVAGVIVPSLGGNPRDNFIASTIAYLDYTMQKTWDFADCFTEGLTCVDVSDNVDVDADTPLERLCSVENGPALTATATCLYYAQSLEP